MTFDYKKYRKKIDSILKEGKVGTIKDLCIKMSEKGNFIESINDDAIEDVSVLIDFYPALLWLRNAMLKNGDLHTYKISRRRIRMFELNAYDSLSYFNDGFGKEHFYYNTNTMELFSLSFGVLHNDRVLFPKRYKEMIDSKDSSIVELPKLNNIDLFLLKYHAVLKSFDTLDDDGMTKFTLRRELEDYEESPHGRLDFFQLNREPPAGSWTPGDKKLHKKYYHESALLLHRFLNSSIFWFLNTMKDAHQLDLRSLLKKIKTSKYNYNVDNTVSTSSAKGMDIGPSPWEDDDLPF